MNAGNLTSPAKGEINNKDSELLLRVANFLNSISCQYNIDENINKYLEEI